jgi:hypothetical protein
LFKGESSDGAFGAAFDEVIVNVCGVDVPPPGVGFVTVTVEVPTAAMLDVEIVAVSDDPET